MNNAVETFQRKHPSKTPNLENLGQYLLSNGNQLAPSIGISNQTSTISRNRNGLAANLKHNRKKSRGTVYDFRAPLDKSAVLEQRLIFIDLLRREYHHQLAVGELDSRGFIPFSLLQSLEFAENSAAKGHPLCDWMASQSVGDVFTKKGDRLLHAYRVGGFCNRKGGDEDFHVIRTQVLQALSFIKAHLAAQQTFKDEFASVSAQALTLAEKAVLDESKEQVAKADAAINNFDEEDVNAVKSQYVCQILLFKSANYFEKLSQAGLMTEKEAGEFLEQYDHELRQLRLSSELKTEIRHLNNQIAPEIPAFSLNVLETIHDKSDLEESA